MKLTQPPAAIMDTYYINQVFVEINGEPLTKMARARERAMRKFKSVRQAQRTLGAHPTISNLFNFGRHLVTAEHYRDLRKSAFAEWTRAVD